MKSKVWSIIRGIVLFGVAAWVIAVSYICPDNILQKFLCLSALALAVLWHMLAMYCPHCGHIFTLRNRLFSETCGRCRNCGKIVYWKEHMKDEDIENI